MRDLIGFRETRLKILTLRPNSKIHWLSYALGIHICGDPDAAIGVLDSYAGTLEEGSKELQRCFESSELALYKNRIISETTNDADELIGVKKALDDLNEIKAVIVDQTGWLQAKLSYELQLGLFDQAEDTCHLLFRRGCTEDHRIHGAYMCAILKCNRDTCLEVQKLKGTGTLATMCPLSDNERNTLIAAYGSSGNDANKNLARLYPRSNAIKRIHLTLLLPSSDEFRACINIYCKNQLAKGVPSLGSDLSSLYLMENNNRHVLAIDPAHVKVHPVYKHLVQLVDSFINTLSSQNTFPDDPTEHPPSTLLWSWYLRATLHAQAGEYADGVALINNCIDHTPTGVDFYELKAKLLEAGGDIQQAADVVDAGRDLDHQDRYINNQATKTLLRAGREDIAKKRISMFAVHEGNPEQNLYDMQCTWFELELADSCRKKGQLGRALRKYSKFVLFICQLFFTYSHIAYCIWRKIVHVIKHYEDYHEDQFDFHAYCIRKVTLRSYCEMLKFEDEIWGLPFYRHAAEEVIKIYLKIIDKPAQSTSEEEPDYSKMTPADRKKAKNIARKKKKAQEKNGSNGIADEDNSANTADNGNKKVNKNHPVNQDQNGVELLALDPAEEAKKFASILVRHAPKIISSWALQYDISVRRGKMLVALQVSIKVLHILTAHCISSYIICSAILGFMQNEKH